MRAAVRPGVALLNAELGTQRPRPGRVHGRRSYEDSALRSLQRVEMAKRYALTVAQMRKVFFSEKWRKQRRDWIRGLARGCDSAAGADRSGAGFTAAASTALQ